ncbi:MAG: ABC transporter substrate-binding protein [Deltaproteobacteria bacterium]|nr:ABC transporter substrate-binding protein [Deltaproteobacteria bacterium]
MKGSKKLWSLVVASVLCLGLATGPAAAADKVKIGASYPLSGGVAQASSWVVEGVKMAAKEINAAGGVQVGDKKMPLEIVLYDSKCDPTSAVGAAEKMINRDQVVAITGDYCSSCTLAQREVSGRHEIVQITPISVNPKITEPGYPYMFRLCNTIGMYAEPFVEFVAEKLPQVKSVGFLAITDDYGRSAVDIYTKLFPNKGVEVKAVEYFKHGDTDFYTQITKLVSAKPDAIYIVTDEDAQNIGTLKQLKELGYKGKIFGCSTYCTDNMVKLGGKGLMEGLYVEGPSFELFKDEPAIKQWQARYNKLYGRDGNAFSLWGYQSVMLLADVIQSAGTITDKKKIQKAMAGYDLSKVMGYRGKPHFDQNGQTHPTLGVVQYQDGKRVPVYPVK